MFALKPPRRQSMIYLLTFYLPETIRSPNRFLRVCLHIVLLTSVLKPATIQASRLFLMNLHIILRSLEYIPIIILVHIEFIIFRVLNTIIIVYLVLKLELGKWCLLLSNLLLPLLPLFLNVDDLLVEVDLVLKCFCLVLADDVAVRCGSLFSVFCLSEDLSWLMIICYLFWGSFASEWWEILNWWLILLASMYCHSFDRTLIHPFVRSHYIGSKLLLRFSCLKWKKISFWAHIASSRWVFKMAHLLEAFALFGFLRTPLHILRNYLSESFVPLWPIVRVILELLLNHRLPKMTPRWLNSLDLLNKSIKLTL